MILCFYWGFLMFLILFYSLLVVMCFVYTSKLYYKTDEIIAEQNKAN